MLLYPRLLHGVYLHLKFFLSVLILTSNVTFRKGALTPYVNKGMHLQRNLWEVCYYIVIYHTYSLPCVVCS